MGTIETEPPGFADTELTKIARLSAQNAHQEFHSLMHHFNVVSLCRCYHKLDGTKAIGADGINKIVYGENLQENVEELVAQMKRMAYRPGPVRQVLIPKEGKLGATRPLGISNFADKLVQKRMQEILESIYEPIFLSCSYGFRPNRGCHDAIKDLRRHLDQNEVESIIDVDLANYFGMINHQLAEEILRKKIKDTKFLRYIKRMFKSGVLSDGELMISEEGVVQGSCCSPIIANIFAHYVIDTWIEDTVKPLSAGKVEAFRYADDAVICCQYASDAKRIKEVLRKRLAKYHLKLNEDKTKLIKFSKAKEKIGEKQESFDFLGFTFYLGRTLRGKVIPKVKTSGKRLRGKLKKVNDWARDIRNQKTLGEIWKIFCTKLKGHVQYYGVSFNSKSVEAFLNAAERILFKWLNRRSQRKSFDWDKFKLYTARHPLPKVKVYCRLF
jgi:RNA-directed DNA polymerase